MKPDVKKKGANSPNRASVQAQRGGFEPPRSKRSTSSLDEPGCSPGSRLTGLSYLCTGAIPVYTAVLF